MNSTALYLSAQKHKGGDAKVGVRGVEIWRGIRALQRVRLKYRNKRQCNCNDRECVQSSMQKLALWPARHMIL